ncbi:MAG TPA: DUF4203 domain-containing protein [Vicinamibacterales bacterium]|jgi:hypothetical protein
MLPHSYELSAALILLLGGALSCFAGYRLFKITLAIYGLIFGAMIASSSMGVSNTTGMIVAAIAGGIAGAIILVLAYFMGIGLIGAGLGALVAHVGWGFMRPGDPPPAVLIALAVLGAVGAMLLQRYVIVVATAFAGSWTMLLGGLAIADRGVERASRVGDVWILYPTTAPPGRPWVPIAWIVIGVIGTIVQLGITGKKK